MVREGGYDVYGGKGRHGWDHIVIVFTSKYVISANHHLNSVLDITLYNKIFQ